MKSKLHSILWRLTFLALVSVLCAQGRAQQQFAEINTESGKYDLEERLIEHLSNQLKSEDSAVAANAQHADYSRYPYQLGGEDDPHLPPDEYLKSELQQERPYEINLEDDTDEEIQDSVDVGSQTAAEVADDQEKPKRKGEPEVPFPPDVPEPLALQADTSDKRAFAGPLTTVGVGDTVFVAVATVCVAGAVMLVGAALIISRRLHRQYKSAEEADYPQYGVTGPIKDRGSPGDAKLASSAHLYHYQHTKQQIIAMEQSHMENRDPESEDESDAEGDEGDFSVYECPGLAPTGDIEVSNPLFDSNGDNQEKVHQPSTEHREDQD